MLKGEHGHQRKELDKLIGWLREHYPNPDIVNLPFALLIGLAAPLRQALGVAHRLHAAGRGSVSRSAAGAVAQRSAGADSRAGARGRSVRAGERLLRADDAGVSRHSARADPDRAARHQLQGLRLPDAARAGPHGQAAVEPAVAGRRRVPSRSASSRASRPKRDSIGSPTPIASCGRSATCRRRDSKPPAGWARTRSRIWQASSSS